MTTTADMPLASTVHDLLATAHQLAARIDVARALNTAHQLAARIEARLTRQETPTMPNATPRPPATRDEQAAVWLVIRVWTSDGTSDPISVRELASLAGLEPDRARAAIHALAGRGLLHIDRRTTAAGKPAPSRYRCTVPHRPDPSRHLDHLMRQTPTP
jgi:hypothetical protein